MFPVFEWIYMHLTITVIIVAAIIIAAIYFKYGYGTKEGMSGDVDLMLDNSNEKIDPRFFKK